MIYDVCYLLVQLLLLVVVVVFYLMRKCIELMCCFFIRVCSVIYQIRYFIIASLIIAFWVYVVVQVLVLLLFWHLSIFLLLWLPFLPPKKVQVISSVSNALGVSPFLPSRLGHKKAYALNSAFLWVPGRAGATVMRFQTYSPRRRLVHLLQVMAWQLVLYGIA